MSAKETVRFGEYGGRYVPETLVPALDELADAFDTYWQDVDFNAQLASLQRDFIGRPTPLYKARALSAASGRQVWIKREDLCHTGAHKINNAVGQCLLAQKLGKKRIIAETGAGQHGVATATACAMLGLKCVVYMGAIDCDRQRLNVFRMQLLGAEVIPVKSGTQTLKDALNEALRDWVTNVRDTHYVIGSVAGPAPFPYIVRQFQAVIGHETRQQFLAESGTLPDLLIACVGGGSNAIGMFHAFVDDPVALLGIEAGGQGTESGENAATLTYGKKAILHGSMSMALQSEGGQIANTTSISAGLDYPGVGPEHSHLMSSGRAQYAAITNEEALKALEKLAKTEGLIAALESAHAFAALDKPELLGDHQNIVINLSGRGDKDIQRLAELYDFADPGQDV